MRARCFLAVVRSPTQMRRVFRHTLDSEKRYRARKHPKDGGHSLDSVFKAGDRVCWSKAIVEPPTRRDVPGTVLQVMPGAEAEDAAFTMYQVQFEFGVFTLNGKQLEHALQA